MFELPIANLLLVFTFLSSIAGLFVLIWSLSTKQFSMGPEQAEVIFAPGEKGVPEEPTQEHGGLVQYHHSSQFNEPSYRAQIDQVVRQPVFYLFGSALVWLLFGSILGWMTSMKFHWPDWLSHTPFLTFGRLRPLHLNTVAYGWLSMAGMGVGLWVASRILKTPLVGARWAVWGTHFWNLGMILGTIALFLGWTDGIEWLEYPWQIDGLFALGGAFIGLPLLFTIKNRKVDHLYVSIWYIGAAFVWMPILFVIANLPGIHFGVQHAIVNWWFAHNVLGLWLTPLGLAAAYYFIPKIIGRPVHSYQLSLLGFWALALFYSQVGLHHLIGGPVPSWLVTLSIVTSVMMVVPVVAVAVNHHMTLVGNFRQLLKYPSLAFIALGAMMYTVTSFQGSLQSMRWLNQISHFTHSTVAHAHLGVYGFVSFILFG
ncbi:MAG: cbb3-type cytochrome c oxidase subunit I, partial [Bdellovibrionaceae bacterium]|nr:cbb3-type cytochrome c oxidase subunit I [Pseudobdellovibrionaceae bacterium]